MKPNPATDPVHVAQRIRGLCDLFGGPAEAARLCGLPVTSIEQYAAGKHLPGAMALAALSKGLSVQVDWILFGDRPLSDLTHSTKGTIR